MGQPDSELHHAGNPAAFRAVRSPRYDRARVRMPLEHLAIIAVILAAGSLLQSAAGFGYGMFTMPLLFLTLGLDPWEAIAIVTTSVLAQTVFGLWSVRRHVPWRTAAWMIAIAGAMVPVGIWLQHELTMVSVPRLKQLIGALILTAVIVKVAWRLPPRASWPWYWGPIACIGSGLTGGLAGMSGPPAVMWVMAHTWSTERARATMWALFTGLAPLSIGVLRLQFGPEVFDRALTGMLMWPVVVLGSLPGLWIGARLSPRTMRGLSVVILTIAAVIAIAQPYV